MTRFAFGVWRAKWNLLRLTIAVLLLVICATDTGARLARHQLAALPAFDYASEVRALRTLGRYGESVTIADAGLKDPALDESVKAAISGEREATVSERNSWITKAKAAGLGALSGRGESLEGLIGAITADFFVIGDIRDLVIEGGKQIIDGDGDGVILTLSVLGVITTLAPEIDWIPSLLKASAKAGTLTARMSEFLKTAIKGKRTEELKHVFADVRTIAVKSSPGSAMQLMRWADEPADVARMARYLDKSGKEGAFALHVAGKEGAEALKAGGNAEAMLLAAARKGRPGVTWLSSPAARALTRPHLLVGVLKAVWKGNAAAVVQRLLDRLDVHAWWVIPALAGWVVIELGLLASRFAGPRPPRRKRATLYHEPRTQ